MAHGYRTLQHWNQWIQQQHLGINLLNAETHLLKQLLKNHFGKHVLLIGVPHQTPLFKATEAPCHHLLSPLLVHDKHVNYIESEFHELPLHTGSIDLVMLPHTLEFVDNPRQLLAEACRVIKPEGLIMISGFNPMSTWGIKKLLTKHKIAPWTASFIHFNQVKRWLQLADFELEQQKTLIFRPPIKHKNFFQKLQFMESIGSKLFPKLGGSYILLARAKVVPLTPIKLKWKQHLSGIRISTTISGHIARSSK